MNILMIGGAGFVGSAIARQLAEAGHNVRIPTRRRMRARHLLVLPTAEIINADVHDPDTLRRLMHGQDAVISLAGILRGDFQRVHVELPDKIGAAAQAAGIRRVIHISSLGAAADAPSAYHRSKAAGEAALQKYDLDLTILRPSVVFGQGDSFLSLFATMQRVLPMLPLACPEARFQPVWVEDVAAVAVACLAHEASRGQAHDLGGPRVYTLRELVRYAGLTAGKASAIIGLNDSLSWLQALVMEWVPGAPLTRDNILSMRRPNVCATQPALPFGLPATSLEAVAPGYLQDDRRYTDNDSYREQARRRKYRTSRH